MAKTVIIGILAIALVITISLQQVEGGVYDIVQLIPCTDGQVRKYESTTSTWDCADDLTGAGGGLPDLNDVTLTSPAYNHILQFLSGQWINKLFAINTQSASNDVFVTGINNQTGVITTNQFSVNSKTCGGTDKISSIDNATGDVVCTTDSTGSTVRETLVSHWDQSITKTNIGTSFINVYNQANSDGKSIYIDTNGMSTVRIQILWNKIGAGTQTVQVIEDGTANVLISLNVVSGPNDSGLVDIPAALENSVKQYVIQAKSTTSTDDPIFEGARIWLKP